MFSSRKTTTAAVLLSAAAAGAVPAVALSDSGPAARTAAAKPAVSDLDIDLVAGRVLHVTVEARHARSVTLTYAGTTRTARLDPDDADDRDPDYVARFTARTGDRAEGRRVAIKITAHGQGGTTTRTLSDRVDVEHDDD
jgi:hypothetical protein